MWPHAFFLTDNRRTDDDIDEVFSTIDDWMSAGRWDLAQETFRQLCEHDHIVQVESEHHLAILIAFLSISLAGKEKIGPWRATAVKRIREALQQVRPAEVEDLLRGLE